MHTSFQVVVDSAPEFMVRLSRCNTWADGTRDKTHASGQVARTTLQLKSVAIIPVAPGSECKGFLYLLLLLWTIICELYARYPDKDWGWLRGNDKRKVPNEKRRCNINTRPVGRPKRYIKPPKKKFPGKHRYSDER
jgi:hypothetical protein